ncbi:MAG: zinc-binding dehydrogenase [Anaerolineales bacterium]
MTKKSMKAVQYLGPGALKLSQVRVPQARKGELIVRVHAATTCGTDVKTFLRGHPKFKPPCPFGHEFAGDVVEVGAGVDRFQIGMRVTANVFAPCGSCFYCKMSQSNLCEDMIYNMGAYAEYIRIPAPIVRYNTFELPDDFPYAQAAILEPLVSVVHAQARTAIQPGERVVILGAGGAIGLMHLQMTVCTGASQAIAVDLSQARLEIAARLGATTSIQAPQPALLDQILDLTEGRGADVVIECAGTVETWLQAVELVRNGGRVVWFGGLPGGTTIALDTHKIHYGELTLLGTHGGTPLDALRAFELLTSGVINSRALISDEVGLDQVQDALERMARGEVVKVAIDPSRP